jgi:hypothetical protein
MGALGAAQQAQRADACTTSFPTPRYSSCSSIPTIRVPKFRRSRRRREPSACSLSCCGRAAKPNLDEVFASLTGQRIGGLIVSTDPFIYDQRDRIIASAAMIEIVSGDADLLSAAELLAYPSRECARGPHEVQIFPYFLHKNPLQRRRVDIAIDANPTPALQLDLDQPRFLAPPSTWCAIDRGRLPFDSPLEGRGFELSVPPQRRGRSEARRMDFCTRPYSPSASSFHGGARLIVGPCYDKGGWVSFCRSLLCGCYQRRSAGTIFFG